MKKSFILKALLLMLTTSLLWCPSAQAAKVEKTIGTIFKSAQASRNGVDGNYSYQVYSRTAGIDASGCERNNLVLEMDLYMQNLDDPGNLEIIDNATFQQIEVANEIGESSTWISWSIKDLKAAGEIKAGQWNHFRLEFAKGRGGNDLDLTRKLNYFRFCLAHIHEPKVPHAVQIRFKNVAIKDKSQFIDTPPEQQYTNTDYNAADLPYSLDGVLTGTNYNGFGVGKKFDPAINVSDHDPKFLYLQFDAEIMEGTPGDINVLKTASGQIELTSGGRPDLNELGFGISTPDWKPGKHTYTLAFSTGSATSGTIDLSAINYMRIFCVHIPKTVDKLTMKVDNVKIIDRTRVTVLPTLFGNGMMFQQNKPIKIWAYSEPTHKISIKLYKGDELFDTKEAKYANEAVGTDGKQRWSVQFAPIAASFDKYKFEVIEDEKTIQTVDDILIGEVWVAGGQSNMALSIGGTQQKEQFMKEANNDNIRFLWMPTYPSGTTDMPYTPTKDIPGAYWGHGNNGTQVSSVSAVAYIAIKELQAKLNIPVGFLYTPIGGSVIEAWLPREELDEDKALVEKLTRIGLYFDDSFWAGDNTTTVTTLYNQKVGPLAGFNVAGTLWYQGESNSGRPELYTEELAVLKKGWERTFNFEKGTMPFVFCQVGRWEAEPQRPQYLAALDEAMYDGWKAQEKSSALLPIYDTDMTYLPNVIIHPTNKIPVGKRFATAMYNLVYAQAKPEYTAPVLESVTPGEGFVTVKFSHVGDGLKTLDGTDNVKGFALADSRNVYVNAQAKIVSSNEVKVWSEGLKDPKSATYAYATYNFKSNLANSVGIPAAPFRSDRTATEVSYYNPQDWTFADGNYWGLEKQKDATGKDVTVGDTLTAWKTVNAEIAYDTAEKQEGVASLKVSYNAPEADKPVSFGPELSYLTIVPQFDKFYSVSAYVHNADARDKKIALVATTADGKTMGCDTVTVKASKEWQLIAFCNGSTKYLPAATAINFSVIDNGAGTLNIDNIAFNLDIVKDTTNGIEHVTSAGVTKNKAANVYFDLAGRRIKNPARSCIYINNGKKIVVMM